MRLADAARHYVHGITHHTWECVGGPQCGEMLPVSRLAAWTACSEYRRMTVQTIGLPHPRWADRDKLGKEIARAGEVEIGHYGQPHCFAPWFAWEPSDVEETYAELLRDHKDALGWRHPASPASWDLLRELVPCPEKKA